MEALDIILESYQDPDISRDIGRQIYQQAKAGLLDQHQFLGRCREADRYDLLNGLYEDDGQRCTPLMIASRLGHQNVVRYLLDQAVDKEKEGVVKFERHAIQGATALWCAAGAGHLAIVSMLIADGANIDHETKNKSTPLRAACFEGRIDIVEFLCCKGANVDKSNNYNNTCLMISSYKGHKEVAEYLLHKGADPNLKALCGATACHFAAEIGQICIVDALLKHGARMEENKHGMTPLLCAAERCQAKMVEYIINLPGIAREDAITALELLGASLANDNDHYDIELSYSYLKRGMELRWQQPVIEKSNLVRTEAYANRIEARTMEELEQISEDTNLIHMEGLCIRERILGQDNPELPYIIIFRGALFADAARFDRCTLLWLHALNLRLGTDTLHCKDLLRFAQMFCQMLISGHTIDIDQVTKVLSATVAQIQLQQKMFNAPECEDPTCIEECIEQYMLTALYLLIIIVDIHKKASQSDIDADAIKEVYKLVQLNPSTSSGSSLLHLAVNQLTPVDEFHTSDVCRFPSTAAAKLLLKCGADPQTMDNQRNTPLHIISSYTKIVEDFITLHTIIMALLDAGAHMDCVNSQGQTPLDVATTGVAAIILKSQYKMSLKCLAANSVRRHNLTYQGQVPTCLENFIEIHGP